jgi:hypothetical protein
MDVSLSDDSARRMVTNLKKLTAPDFTASIKPGMAALNRREFLGHDVRPSLV